MSSKRGASMIIGILMGLETCLIIGQVSHNLLYWKKKLDTISLLGEYTVLLRTLVEVEGQQELREIENKDKRKLDGMENSKSKSDDYAWMRRVQTRGQLEPRDLVCNEWRWRRKTEHELTKRLRAHSLVKCRVSCALCWSWMSRRHWCRTFYRAVSLRMRNSKLYSCCSPTLSCRRQFKL